VHGTSRFRYGTRDLVRYFAVTIGGAAEAPYRRNDRGAAIVRRIVDAITIGLVPAVLVALVLRYLVPPTGAGFPGVVSTFWHRGGLYFGAALFLAFNAIAAYWRARLLGASGSPSQMPHAAAGAPVRPFRRAREAVVLLLLIGIAVASAFALRAHVARPYRVRGGSMLPSLEPEDLVLARPKPYGGDASRARRGDVVVFPGSVVAPGSGAALPEILVKRVIGLPGDRVSMSGGTPIINGWKVPSCDAGEYMNVLAEADGHALHGRLRVEFLDDQAYLTVHSLGSPPFPDAYVVKPGEVFVLGDDRGNSFDSRAYGGGHGGGVPAAGIDARVQWFLAGTHRSGDVDLDRLLRPVDALQKRIHLEGLQTHFLDEGLAKCLANRPTETRPPPANL
jgi:signal peptidase I